MLLRTRILRGLRTAAAPALALALVALALTPLGMATQTTATTTNATPTIDAVYLYASDPSSGAGALCPSDGRVTSFNPAAGTARNIYVCAETSDTNGYNDICDSGATSASDSRVFSVTDHADVSISDAAHPKSSVGLTCAAGSDTRVALVGSFAMEYWRPVGLAASATAYKVVVAVSDVAGAAATTGLRTFDWTALTSLDASGVTSLNLGGAIAPGGQGSETSATFYNAGNTAFTLFANGTALTGDAKAQTIAVGNLRFATSASQAYATKTSLGLTPATTGLSMPAETSDTPTARVLYLQLGAPAATGQWIPADTYKGSVTFTAG